MQKSRLPEAFLADMRQLLGDEYEHYLTSMEERAMSGLRVNTLKTSPEAVESMFGSMKPVPWTQNGFYITEESRFTKSPYYYAGLYYIQEPSAMSSAALLGTRPGERILDLCAAPGGKTTQIAADLKGRGFLVSNDLSASRAKALLKNIELMGIGNACISCEESGKLADAFPLYFDRILVDAPCSGEGMFRKRPAVIRAWQEHGKDFYCQVQRTLLEDAARMLHPGGTLLYSTCTYNVNENEVQIQGFLKEHPDFVLDPIPILSGFTSSRLLPGCIRLFPHKAEAEGHFVARLKKRGEQRALLVSGFPDTRRDETENGSSGFRNEKKQQDHRKNRKGTEDNREALRLFFEKSCFRPRPEQISLEGEYVLCLPEDGSIPDSLRYLRTGLLLGRLKNGRFKPSQALAMFLKKEDWVDPIDVPAESEAVMRYLRGETLDTTEKGTGYRLFCADGFPLGFVKQDRQRLKNMYLPGWRMQ